jgi:hypothetical protein
MALGLPNGIPFCWQPPVKTASDIESSPNLRISADGGVSEFSNGCLDGRAFSLVQASPVGVLPSLLIVPQSYKSGKLYAQLPNARVNHIPNNSMFGASGGVLPSGWTFSVGAASGVSLGYSASGQVTAEDGTLVDYIDFTFSGTATASGFLNLRPNASPSTISSVSGQSWNASVYFQLISGSVASISPTYQLQETTSGGTFIDGSNITGLGSLTTSLPLRRYNVTRDLDTSGTVVTCRWGHSIATGTTYNYTLRIGSPQLENLSSPTSVIRTVSGAVYAPYSGENVRTNLALQSENFTTTWFGIGLNAFGSGSVANSTGTTDPFGGTNADYIQENSASGTHLILQINAGQVSGTNLTFSVFAKAAERTQINLLNNGGGGGSATFNLTAGTATLISGISASIQNYGNGWYRCIFTYTPNATGNFNVQVRLVDASGNTSYTGTGTSGLYVFGAQLETGSSATPYIRTTTAPNSFPIASIADFTVSRNTTATRVDSSGLIESVASGVPRIDWLGQSCPALLVEPSATNFARWVNQMTAQDTPTASGGMTITTGSTDFLAPDGTSGSITKYVGGAASGTTQYAYYTGGGIVATASGAHTFSLFVKRGATNPLNFCALQFEAYAGASGTTTSYFNLASGTALTAGASIVDYGNGWYRLISAPLTLAAGDLNGQLIFWMAEGNNDLSWPASGALNLTAYTWGAQLETGSIATTYIPTTTVAAVSRAADVISASGALVSGLIGQTEGTIYAEVVNTLVASYAEAYVYRVFADANNEIWARKEGGGTTYSFRWRANSQNTTFLNVAVPNGVNKIAFGYKSGDTALFLNGSQVATTNTDVRAFSVNPTTIALGSTSSGQFFNDRIRAAALYTTRLSNAQLAELTRL